MKILISQLMLLRCGGWCGRRGSTTHRFKVMLIFPAEMEPKSTKNGVTSISTQGMNLETSKTPVSEVSCKSSEFDKLTQKSALTYNKGIFPNLVNTKIFTNLPCPYVKLDEKNDSEVADTVRPTVLKLCTYFLQKYSLGPPKMVLLRFPHRE